MFSMLHELQPAGVANRRLKINFTHKGGYFMLGPKYILFIKGIAS